MKVLCDTNILLRGSERRHPHYTVAKKALRALTDQGWELCISSQSIAEFLAVATRSAAERGLGMSHEIADAELSRVTGWIQVLYDSIAVVDELRRLVVAHQVVGKSVHDTKLVATMNTYRVTHLLTLNSRDFVRFTQITVLDPTTMPL